MKRALASAAAWLAACSAACNLLACDDDVSKRTQIVVAVGSDLSVPGELDEVRVQARATRAGAMATEPAIGRLGVDGVELPVSVTFEPSGDGLGPIEVTASGYLDRTLVVSQVRKLSFARGKSVVLRMDLTRACADAAAPDCDAEQTCVAGSCEEQGDVGDLPAYDGRDSLGSGVPSFDGGVIDAGATDGATGAGGGGAGSGPETDGGAAGSSGGTGGGGSGTSGGTGGGGSGSGGSGGEVDAGPDEPCEPVDETCNGVNDDCDGATDEGFDFGSPEHCGACDNVCPDSPPFAISVCVSGECTLLCAPGTDDCNEILEDGCEARLSDVETCGDCDTACDNDEPFCAQNGNSSMCVGSCGGETPDECGESCVDTQTDVFHCSDCDEACDDPPNGNAVCEDGSCGFECPGAFQDCDGMSGNGCETDTERDVDACGGCANDDVCPSRPHSTRNCVESECGFVCATNYGNCNGVASDGCETNTYDNEMYCGSCNVRCTGSQVCCGTHCGTLSVLGVCL